MLKYGIFFSFFIFLFILLNCDTVYSQVLEQLHSVGSIQQAEQEMPLSAISPPKDGHVVPSMASKALGHRYPQIPIEVDGYAIAPDNLRLEQVHIYVRHGERTPVGVRLANPPASIPEHWTMCRTARRFRTALSNMLGVSSEKILTTNELHHRVDEMQQVRKLVEQIDGTTTEGVCLLGELTDLGHQVSPTTARLHYIFVLTIDYDVVNLPFRTQSSEAIHRQIGFPPKYTPEREDRIFSVLTSPFTRSQVLLQLHAKP